MARAKTTETPVTPEVLTVEPSTVDVSTLPPLYFGMIPRASYVRLAQEILCAKGYPCMTNGTYDRATVAAVQRLQNANKLTPNGIVDAEIWRLLTS